MRQLLSKMPVMLFVALIAVLIIAVMTYHDELSHPELDAMTQEASLLPPFQTEQISIKQADATPVAAAHQVPERVSSEVLKSEVSSTRQAKENLLKELEATKAELERIRDVVSDLGHVVHPWDAYYFKWRTTPEADGFSEQEQQKVRRLLHSAPFYLKQGEARVMLDLVSSRDNWRAIGSTVEEALVCFFDGRTLRDAPEDWVETFRHNWYSTTGEETDHTATNDKWARLLERTRDTPHYFSGK